MEFGGEEEVELSLGLAIGGGGCGKRERTEDRVSEATAVVDMLNRKKEMQALRRSEARRKREEKKRIRVVRNNSITLQPADDGGDEPREGDTAGLPPQAVKSEAGEDTEQAASMYAFPMYAYPSFQYTPFVNGISIPYVVPLYRTETDASNKSVSNQTVSFRPFQCGNKRHAVNGVNFLNDDENVKAVSHGSVGYCPSAVSENLSISSQDDSSSDSASHWSRPRPVDNADAKKANNGSLASRPQPTSAKASKEESPSSEMPCVSTTGNGPDGKTITGFLYSYSTTAEVCIVCVCHGESFSPAEFVKHAGGIDIANPLRHITVVPSAF